MTSEEQSTPERDDSIFNKPEATKKPHKMLKLLLVILAVILLVGGTGFGIWYWQNGEINKQKSESETRVAALQKKIQELNENKSSDTTASMANARTEQAEKKFTNNDCKYSLEYPSDLLYKDITVELIKTQTEARTRGGGGGPLPDSEIVFGQTAANLTLTALGNESYSLNLNCYKGLNVETMMGLPMDNQFSTRTIDGLSWTTRNDPTGRLTLAVERKGILYLITVPGKTTGNPALMNKINKILNSIKFTD